MIVGAAGFDLTSSLEVEKLSESTGFRGIEILLHQDERDSRAPLRFETSQAGGAGPN
jgi:hypothetical protein